MSDAEAVAIERAADAAWPAAERVPLGDWTLRATHGVTRRANSVLTAGGANLSGGELERAVVAAEAYYARRTLPPVFQISAATGATGLDALLERRGYRVNGASEVWTLATARCDGAESDDVERAGEPTQGWFDCAFDEVADRRRVHEQIVRRVPWPRAFVSVEVDGVVAGCGMGASVEGRCGIFCMSTRPAYRRRGIAHRIVRAICNWARSRGDERLYLQVMRENDAAKALYRRVGFAFAYGYHYRVR